MQDRPAISIIIPTCNRPQLLQVTLRSLAWQTFRDFEAIVVNDGEEDVAPVVARFANAFPLVLKEHERKRSGLPAARNTGILASRGRWLAYLDDDDFFYEEHLELLYKCVALSGDKVVYSDGVQATQRLRDGVYETVTRSIPFSFDFSPALLAGGNITPVLTVLHQRDCLGRSGLFAPYLKGHEDWDLWQRMARHFPFRHIKAMTAEYLRREGAGSMTDQKAAMLESWLFARRQGMLFNAMPPVYELERRAALARRLGGGQGPCKASVILAAGDARAFLGNAAACASLDAVCEKLGEAQLVLAGSGDAMPELYQRAAKSAAKNILCLWTPEDAGRVLTCSAAARLAQGDWLLFLEPFVEPGNAAWLDALVAAAESSPRAGAIGGLVEGPKGQCILGGRLPSRGDVLFNSPRKKEPDDSPQKADCLSGLCLLVGRDRFFELGGFSPVYAPAHYADADFCLRLGEQGLDSLLAPDARLVWNRQDLPLEQSPAGLVSRRTFWDVWRPGLFSLDRYTTGSGWSMRPKGSADFWPSEGSMPHSFDPPIPPNLLEGLPTQPEDGGQP